jgi:uncharacterized protein
LNGNLEETMKLTDGEKLILMMLADIYKHLEIEGEFDPDFVTKTISCDYLWGFNWEFSGIPFETEKSPVEVTETVDILEMWRFLEESYAKLPDADKQRVQKETHRSSEIKFPGFDANNEPHYGITKYFIEQLHRFEHFKDHYLNSHSERLGSYKAMYRVFEPLRKELGNRLPFSITPVENRGQSLTADEVIRILNADRG